MEFDNYLHLDVYREVEEGVDPLMFYGRHNFPILSQLALKYFTVISSSTPSERAFSCMGRIISKSRARMKPETASALIFLEHNTDLW